MGSNGRLNFPVLMQVYNVYTQLGDQNMNAILQGEDPISEVVFFQPADDGV
jgi:hypothetical protein